MLAVESYHLSLCYVFCGAYKSDKEKITLKTALKDFLLFEGMKEMKILK